MNTMFLQLASLAHELIENGGGTAVKSPKGSTGFLPIIQESLSPHAQNCVYDVNSDAQMDLIGKDAQLSIELLRKAFLARSGSSGNRFLSTKDLPRIRGLHAGNSVYHANSDAQMDLIGKDAQLSIELLRKAFLAKGGSLQNLFLRIKDLPVIRKLLYQCGLSNEDIEQFLQELFKDNPSRQISLKEFFDKAAELEPRKGELDRNIHLESSAIPYIEAALRDCGITPKQIDPVLSAARERSGDLNLQDLAHALEKLSSNLHADGTNKANKLRLHRLVRELEDAVNRIVLGNGQAERNQITVSRDFVQRLTCRLDNLGKGSVAEGAGNTISMEHVSSGVEKTAPGQGNQLPAEVADTIEQIVKSAGMAKTEDGPTPVVSPFSKAKLVELYPGQRNAKGKNSKNTVSSLEGRGATRAVEQNSQPLSLSGKTGMSNELELGRAGEGRQQDGSHELWLKLGINETHSNPSGPSFLEVAGGVSESERPAAMRFLPGYLVEQVGRQIARSLLGGKRVLRLQLRPPELGTLKVEMDIREDVLRLGMITDNSSVKELLLSKAHELRDALVEQGVKLERLDVQINHNANQFLAHTREDPGEEQRWVRDANGFLVPEPKSDEDPITGPRTLASSHHVLDVII